MINKSIAEAEDKLSLKKEPVAWKPLPVPEIADIIKKTPFAEVLGTRCYKKLSKKRCTQLNLNWTRHPEARLVASHMLAGAILYNVQTGEAILVNEVETYGRGRIHDSHREQSGVAKDNIPMPTSMPSTTGKDYYKDVHPVTYDSKQDGKRLQIRTKTCDMLITSCVRLDRTSKAPFSLGGATLNFEILEAEVHNIRIFLDSEQVEAAKEMIGKPISEITENMGIECMRQIKSKFDKLDTYDLSRCSGPLTATFLHRPHTIFTVGDQGKNEGPSHGARRVFFKIGEAVLLHHDNAELCLDEVKKNMQMCQTAKDICVPFNAIAKLFGSKTKITIIGNAGLDEQLTKLSSAMSKPIREANKKVVVQLQALFGVATVKAA